ncbi:MAG: class I SAM-dependent methyltransferase [Chloroflexi bacterium]|nr:class I SAM-dependent methyltransferase [Chloroflexota bacterium]
MTNSQSRPGIKIDLGCGDGKVRGAIGVDNVRIPGVDIIADLNHGLPFKDNSVDTVVVFHILEHVDNFLDTMNEIWRVCKEGAYVHVRVPHAASTFVTWKDPTHRRGLSIATFAYFDDTYFDGAAFAYYAEANFLIEHAQLNFSLTPRDKNFVMPLGRKVVGALFHSLANRNRRWQYFCERFWGPIVGIEEAVLTMRAQKKPRPSKIATASRDEISALKR